MESLPEKLKAPGKAEEEILEGLSRSPKTLPSKFFYDERGSELFEEISSLEEYYLTTAEINIMKNHIDEITSAIGPGVELVEFGSGSSLKTRLLLDHMKEPAAYIPIDISEEFLAKEAEKLKTEYPGLTIKPLSLDYSKPFELSGKNRARKKVIYFPGSTIGNFLPDQAKVFLKKCARIAGKNSGLLIGVDTKKDPEILRSAYNDPKGVTAAFNKNILVRLNREFEAGFNPDDFNHAAIYNEHKGRVEMHLISKKRQKISVAGKKFLFRRGEKIITEYSYKYSPEEFQNLASDYFDLHKVWTGKENLFGIYYFLTKN